MLLFDMLDLVALIEQAEIAATVVAQAQSK
jgi:hypothetical protein